MCYGVSELSASVLSRKSSPISIAFWYFLASSVVLAIIGVLFFKPPVVSAFYAMVFAAISIVSAGALIIFYKGLSAGKISIVAPVANGWAIIAVVVGAVLLHESVGAVQIVGVALAITGTVLVSIDFRELRKLGPKAMTDGVKYALAAMIGWGVFFTVLGILSKQFGWFWPVLIIAVGSTLFILAYAAATKVKLALPARAMMGTALFYIAVTIIATLAYSIGTNIGYIAFVGPISASSPFMVVLLAAALFKERMSRLQMASIAMIIIGMVAIAA